VQQSKNEYKIHFNLTKKGLLLMKEYKHIGLKERKSIYMSLQYGLSINHIAKKLNRSRSTIYRELARNKEKKLYLPDTANKIYLSRYKGRSKAIKVNSNMYHFIYWKS
jgi:IS30 family transposase